MRCKWNTISLFTAVSAITTVTTAEESAVTVVQSRVPQKRCDHPIYCDGPILKAVQLSGIFDNDKTFVDMPTRKPVGDIVTAFNALPANASKSVLSRFVDTNFYPAGSDVVEAELDDWNDNPPFLDGVTDPVLRGYGMAIHNRWKTMARKRDTSFLCDGCESSLLPINNVFFAAGGDSSREYRYWNTYYIEIGLLNSGLYTTAKGVLQNLLDMIKLYDFVPTGGRIYYTDRTETPLLALMIKTYYDATKDLAFVTEALPLLKIEHEFWESYRSVNITYTRNSASSLFDKHSSNSTLLRPESYSSDVAIVAAAARTTAPNLFSSSLTGSGLYAATEAGTTPSIQFADKDTDQLTVLGSVEINTTIAVSLNSILYQAEMIIADLIELVDNKTSPECTSYRSRAEDRRQLLLDLTYNSESGLFADYHLASGKQTDIWSITSLWPYWAFGESLPEGGAQKAVDNFDFLHQRFPGGMPNTLYNTSLSWDYPNVQPPLQHMAVRS
ncbi:Six-hairpin glycosidase-like protein, partial [Coemansia spiralis]